MMLIAFGLFGAACGLTGVGVWAETRWRRRLAQRRRDVVIGRLYAGIRAQARREYPPAA